MSDVRVFPRHGTRARVRNLQCGCVACVGRTGTVSDEYRLKWPLRPLKTKLTPDILNMWVDDQTILRWTSNGLSDAEADEIAIRVGLLPHTIWSGYIEAGLDYRE